jgi:hypothetical protein
MSASTLADYLIDHEGIDWTRSLSSWHWLVPREFTLWMVTRIADLFIVPPDGTVHMLDVGGGDLKMVAESREDFREKADLEDNANQWFAIPLVDRLVAAGMILQPRQCYAYKRLPILGGDYTVDNFAPVDVADWLGCLGDLQGQLKDLPDGAEVRLIVSDTPKR